MKRGLANTPFSARTQRFTAAAAEIRRERAREWKEEKIYMHVPQTNSREWGKKSLKLSARVPVWVTGSKGRPWVTAVNRETVWRGGLVAVKKKTKKKQNPQRKNKGWKMVDRKKNRLQAFCLYQWSETTTDCREGVDLPQISHFGAKHSVI